MFDSRYLMSGREMGEEGVVVRLGRERVAQSLCRLEELGTGRLIISGH